MNAASEALVRFEKATRDLPPAKYRKAQEAYAKARETRLIAPAVEYVLTEVLPALLK